MRSYDAAVIVTSLLFTATCPYFENNSLFLSVLKGVPTKLTHLTEKIRAEI